VRDPTAFHVYDAVLSFEVRQTEALELQRQKRHLRQTDIPLFLPAPVSSARSATVAGRPTLDCAVTYDYTTYMRDVVVIVDRPPTITTTTLSTTVVPNS